MRKKYAIWYLVLSALAVACVSSQSMAATPAGTTIPLYAEYSFSSADGVPSAVFRSNTVFLKVGQVFSVSCSVDAASKLVAPSKYAIFKIFARNEGNGIDSFIVRPTCLTSGWSAAIFDDTDADGGIDEGELKSTITTPAVAAGATYACTVIVYPTSMTSAGDRCSAAVSVLSNGSPSASASSRLLVEVEGPESIKEWQFLGPFTNDADDRLSRDYLDGEADAAPGAPIAGRGWIIHASADGNVNMADIFGPVTNSACYAGVYIYADANRQVSLECTTSGDYSVWLNGRNVGMSAVQNLVLSAPGVRLDLMQGWNRLVVKLAQTANPWEFSAALVDDAGDTPEGIQVIAQREPQNYTSVTGLKTSNVTNKEATVSWYTDNPTSTVLDLWVEGQDSVRYDDPVLKTEHVVTVGDLSPTTRYLFTPRGIDVFGYEVTGQTDSFTTSGTAANVWINKWLINGPHYHNYSIPSLSWDAIGNEPYIYPFPGLISQGRAWIKANAGSMGELDFHTSYPGAELCIGYAHVYVYSPVNRTALLLTGSDDGIRVYVNGRSVLYKNTMRRMVPDDDMTPIALRMGWNRLLFKVLNSRGSWQLCARLTDTSQQPLTDIMMDTSWHYISYYE